MEDPFSTTMQIRIFSRLWFCRRPWRLEVNIKRNSVHFRSHTFVLTSWMYKKQTSVSHSSTETEVISFDTGSRMDWIPVSRSLAFTDWEISLHAKPNQQNQKCKRATEELVGNSSTKHSKTNSNHEHQPRSFVTFHQAEHILVPMLCCMSLRTMKPWSRWS